MDGGGPSSIDQLPARADLPPFPVVQYIEQYGDRLHSMRFSAIHLAGDVQKIPDVPTASPVDTAVGAWIKQWWNWSGCDVTDSLCLFT